MRLSLPNMWLRAKDDRGLIGGADILLFGVIAFVITALVIINIWNAVDSALVTSSAAREGVRSYVESPSQAEANARGAAAVQRVFDEFGRGGSALPAEIDASGGFLRCEVVTVTARYEASFIKLPGFDAFGPTRTVEASHSERIDAFRSGDFGWGPNGDCT